MTPEEYITKRVLELEEENKRLKLEIEMLKSSKTVRFSFEDRDMSKHIYKVKFENGNVKISKKELE
jgi:hypothetical protein